MADTLIGTLNGPQYAFEADIAEWSDVLRYRVTGAASAYAAVVALNTAGKGYGGAHPTIPGISGCMVQMEQSTDEGYILQTTYRRPPMGIWPNPASMPIRMSVRYGLMQIPSEVDQAGNLVVNSAGDPYDPPQTTELLLVQYRLVKWISNHNQKDAEALIGRVNNADVTLPNSLGMRPIRTLKCLNCVPLMDQFLQPGTTNFYPNMTPILFEFEYKSDKYDRKILDKGFQGWYSDEADTQTLKGKIVMKRDLQAVPRAVLLDGEGAPLLFDAYTVKDPKNGFSLWGGVTNAESGLPTYITPTQKASGQGFYLPYRMELEGDFSFFVTAGL